MQGLSSHVELSLPGLDHAVDPPGVDARVHKPPLGEEEEGPVGDPPYLGLDPQAYPEDHLLAPLPVGRGHPRVHRHPYVPGVLDGRVGLLLGIVQPHDLREEVLGGEGARHDEGSRSRLHHRPYREARVKASVLQCVVSPAAPVVEGDVLCLVAPCYEGEEAEDSVQIASGGVSQLELVGPYLLHSVCVVVNDALEVGAQSQL